MLSASELASSAFRQFWASITGPVDVHNAFLKGRIFNPRRLDRQASDGAGTIRSTELKSQIPRIGSQNLGRERGDAAKIALIAFRNSPYPANPQ
jgi:hypothetical protein